MEKHKWGRYKIDKEPRITALSDLPDYHPLKDTRGKFSRWVVVDRSCYLKASPLPPAPWAVAGFMVAGLAAWQYSDRLAGLLGFAVWVLFC